MPRRSIAAALCAAWLLTGGASADDYPARLITIIVPFAAGSGSDTAARVIGEVLGPKLGQTIVVENRVGATGAIAATAVARAAPDGYTLLLGTNSTHGSNDALYRNLAYDALKDFAPVADTGTFDYALVVDPQLPVKSVGELVAYAKSNPGKLTYAGGSSTSIVMAETFAKGIGAPIEKVAYRSNPQALTDVMAGRVSIMFVDISSSLGFIKAGTLRALATTTKQRSKLLPDLPTIDETAVPGFDLSSWTGLYAPAGTPAPVVEKLNAAVNAVLARPDVDARFANVGIEVTPMSVQAFTAFTRAEVPKWARLVREAGIEAQ